MWPSLLSIPGWGEEGLVLLTAMGLGLGLGPGSGSTMGLSSLGALANTPTQGPEALRDRIGLGQERAILLSGPA